MDAAKPMMNGILDKVCVHSNGTDSQQFDSDIEFCSITAAGEHAAPFVRAVIQRWRNESSVISTLIYCT